MKFSTLLLLIFTIFTSKITAQCTYRLEMTETFGNTWQGAQLTIQSGLSKYQFTLDGINDDGKQNTVFFVVEHDLPLLLNYKPSPIFNAGIGFRIFDNDGIQIYTAQNPAAGNVNLGVGKCPPCLEPANFSAENIWDTRVRLRWTALVTSVVPKGWWVIYGEPGFSPAPGVGDSVYVTLPRATITGLKEKTKYDFYLRQVCDTNLVTELIGPLSIETYWSDDVGISAVLSPTSSCLLTANEKVTVVIKNSGANPQSLFSFFYSVNGIPANITIPADGFLTAVVGKDSCLTIPFDTRFDFSAAGEYVIRAWTNLPNDDDRSNDTLVVRVNNHLKVPYLQDFEEWDGGWTASAAANSTSVSWQHGEPAGSVIKTAARGKKAWVTQLNGNYPDREHSYLTSPCYDFSAETSDPAVQFSIFTDLEDKYDGCWLELSTDDGNTWQRLGKQNEGLNWYSDRDTSQSWGDWWSGASGGWRTARHTLNGVAQKKNVRLRFVFVSDEFANQEGVGIDDIRILRRATRDFAAERVIDGNPNDFCGNPNETITLRVVNVGSAVQNSFSLAYRINNQAVVSESITNADLAPDEILTYTFTKTFDSRDGLFNIAAWSNLASDANRTNDTTRIVIDHRPAPVPLFENFETQILPTGWSSTGVVVNSHGNSSYVLAANLHSFEQAFEHTLPRHGLISAGDSLLFDYRITNFPFGTVPTVLASGTEFFVEVSTDCGNSFQNIFTINNANHQPSAALRRVEIDLSAFAGKGIILRFRGFWSAGDFFFDLDNINIRTCPASMQLSAVVTPAAAGQNNGAATANVGLGNPPYQYLWSTGAITPTVTGLAIGKYFVTVTDSKGCSDVLEVSVGNSAVADIIGLARAVLQPNPSDGRSDLVLQFDEPVTHLQISVLNAVGQVLHQYFVENQLDVQLPLDISSQPSGIYLVQLRTANGVRNFRWVKN